ncbi:MAG: hypothetical protein NXH95_08435 [Pseudomonadaceae bacterium]|nr:hypothetical protein [Pseudomonadaceae bacterium]
MVLTLSRADASMGSGIGIVHGTWILAGGLVMDDETGPVPMFFLMPVLGFTAALPILGAAQMALAEFSDQMRHKIENNVLRAGSPLPDVSGVIGEAALRMDTAELVLRDVMADVMAKRNKATNAERAYWLSRMAYAAYTYKEATLRISEKTSASAVF